MGEAKRKISATQKLISRFPFCVLCGGNAPATTRDHVPNIGLFRKRQRPEGLETPACDHCNQNTKQAEQVASFLAAIYPDPTPDFLEESVGRAKKALGSNPALLAELKSISPKKIDEFQANSQHLPLNVSPLNASGPILNTFINIFAIKCCIALHFHLTGKIVPDTGSISSRWFSNYEAVTGRFPDHLLNIFDGEKTLQQGKLNVRDQFWYSSKATKDELASIHFCAFGQSFSFYGFVHFDAGKIPEDFIGARFKPGFWNNSKDEGHLRQLGPAAP